MKIWISRDEDSVDLDLWSVAPEIDRNGKWDYGTHELLVDCKIAHQFFKKILGGAWKDEGSLCAEITVASVKTVLSDSQNVAAKLKNMTKANFRKATINEAVKLLEGK